MGRSDDMMVVKGVNVWPSQIEAVLLKQGYQANYQILVDRIGNNETITRSEGKAVRVVDKRNLYNK